MSDYIEREKAIEYFMINTNWHDEDGYSIDDWDEKRKLLEDYFNGVPSADVQPVTYCKDCQWLADIKDIETGELYHTCGVLGFEIPDGFACNQGRRKGADNGTDKG